MTRLEWNTAGSRVFEVGVDRCVLYPKNAIGVPWNGVTSINEAASGGEPRPYYVDGYKYRNLSSTEEFAATINALTCPKEFYACVGMPEVANGLFAAQQKHRMFDFSYRTLVGNDVKGETFGYKTHLVYNALASASPFSFTSLGADVTPTEFSWDISSMAPRIQLSPARATGLKPTAHLIIDSRFSDAGTITQLENILYGTTNTSPVMPTQETVYELFNPVIVP